MVYRVDRPQPEGSREAGGIAKEGMHDDESA
jgi:hypothetical protein